MKEAWQIAHNVKRPVVMNMEYISARMCNKNHVILCVKNSVEFNGPCRRFKKRFFSISELGFIYFDNLFLFFKYIYITVVQNGLWPYNISFTASFIHIRSVHSYPNDALNFHT